MNIPEAVYIKPDTLLNQGICVECSFVAKEGYIKLVHVKPSRATYKDLYWLCFDLTNGDGFENPEHNYVWIYYSEEVAVRRYKKHKKRPNYYGELSYPTRYLIGG